MPRTSCHPWPVPRPAHLLMHCLFLHPPPSTLGLPGEWPCRAIIHTPYSSPFDSVPFSGFCVFRVVQTSTTVGFRTCSLLPEGPCCLASMPSPPQPPAADDPGSAVHLAGSCVLDVSCKWSHTAFGRRVWVLCYSLFPRLVLL